MVLRKLVTLVTLTVLTAVPAGMAGAEHTAVEPQATQILPGYRREATR